MQFRPATTAEILDKLARQYIPTVRYRHFVRELYNPRAANGVSHRQYSQSKVRMVGGIPHVMYHGELTAITASICTLDSGTEFVCDIRIDNKYLPAA